MKKSLGVIFFTLWESVRKGTLVFYFGFGTLVILILIFSIGRSPEDPNAIVLFGKTFDRAIGDIDIASFLLLQLYSSASSALMLFGLFATAGLIPSLLEKGTIELFLSKPISRPVLLLSRSLGGVLGIALNILYFIVAVWLVFGIKLGVWHWGFLATSLATSFTFFCFFSVAALVGVVSQSTGVAIIFGFGVSLFSSILETRETFLFRIWDNVVFHRFLDLLYYLLPQLSAMSRNSAMLIARLPGDFMGSGGADASFSVLPFLFSGLSAALLYLVAVRVFQCRDF